MVSSSGSKSLNPLRLSRRLPTKCFFFCANLIEKRIELKKKLCYVEPSTVGFPGEAVVKNLPANAGDSVDMGSTPGLRRSPAEGNGYLLQYSCLGNPKDRGVWRATVHGVAKRST